MSTPRTHTLSGAIAVSVLACTGLIAARSAGAQQTPTSAEEPKPRYVWEVTPFVGYRMGGDFELTGVEGNGDLSNDGSLAFAVNLAIDELSAYELFYSRQETGFESSSPAAPFDLDVEYLHLGGTLVVNQDLPIVPYIVGGLGITRFTPESGGDDARFSISLGGGLRVPVNPRFSVRLEARAYVTFVNSDTAFFCASGSFGGACAIQARTDTFFQYELLAGAAFAF